MKRSTIYIFRALSFVCLGALLLPSHYAIATVYQVGPNKAYQRPSDVAELVQDGDTIEIDAGVYPGDVAIWRRHNLTLRGLGGYAHMRADRRAAQGKAIWVIKGNNTTIEQIEFSGATVADQNGAGLRLEGSGVVIRRCYFHDNENGILGGGGDILIEHSEFAWNGFGDGQSHNIYILENTRRFTLRFSYSHHTKVGHNVKSRARENHILYNRIMDEVEGQASYAIDLPNGGVAYLIGNIIQQGPHNENSTVMAYAAEGLRHTNNQLYVINNTLVNDDPSAGRFISLPEGVEVIRIVNNIFVGVGTPVTRKVEMVTNLSGKDAGLVDRRGFDYRLRPGSPAINAGSHPGAANELNLIPDSQYVHPRQGAARVIVDGAIDIGAYEFTRTTSPR